MNSLKKFKEQIINSKKIAIVGHEGADVDSLASIVTIKRVIINNKDVFGEKEIHLLVDSDIFENIFDPITNGETFINEADGLYDLVICVDSPNKQRLGKFETTYDSAKNTLMIDHHENTIEFADNNYIYKCTSTCELLYIIFKALNLEVSNDVLKMIYAGMITDTVNLTQGTVKVSSYRIVAEIAERLNDMETLNAIKDHFLKNKTKSNLILLERALRSMSFYLNDRVAIMKITKEDMVEADGTQSDTMGIVNNAINIKGVAIAILFIKQDDGSYYASLRSKNGVDVGQIASRLGGGGHETVAAFSHNKNLSELKSELLMLCEEALLNQDDDSDSFALFEE